MKITAYILLKDGIGNIIQSIPFIKELKKRYKKVIGVDKANFSQSSSLLNNILDDIIPIKDIDSIINIYSNPPLRKYGNFPEYKSWFLFHNFEGDEFNICSSDVVYDTEGCEHYDIVLWGGCQPLWKTKQWPYWPDLAALLIEKYSVAVVGLPGEGGVFPKKVSDLRGEIPLTKVGGYIYNASFYIGNEGGITHYANALQKEMWVIWGGASPEKNTPPYRKEYHHVSKRLDCQPCQFRLSPKLGCGDYKCLDTLLPKTVYEQFINERPGSSV